LEICGELDTRKKDVLFGRHPLNGEIVDETESLG
jgi:hypothetical protein